MSVIRTHAPASQSINHVDLLQPSVLPLENGQTIHLFKGGSQEVTKIDVILPAGSVQAGKLLLASTTCNLLAEGTARMSSEQIAEQIDYYGAYLGYQAHYHHAAITLLTLSRYLPQTIDLLFHIIQDPVFPQHEIDLYLAKRKQEYLIDSQKVNSLSSRRLTEEIFGREHPYGRPPEADSFDAISRQDIIHFHKKNYPLSGATFMVSGQPGEQLTELFEKQLKGITQSAPNPEEAWPPLGTLITPDTFFIKKKDAVQSAIKLGRRLFNMQHPDFKALQVVNSILGGYFGSRLVRNLREEKGYTYGISSYLISLKKGGYWVISSEVRQENTQAAIEEIKKEMYLLHKNGVKETELDLVKNYMLGDFLRQFDSAFATSDVYRGLIEVGYDLNYFNELFSVIKNIDTQTVNQLTRKYLHPDDFITVQAGA
jgi:predicted Zn-dependent peptidase